VTEASCGRPEQVEYFAAHREADVLRLRSPLARPVPNLAGLSGSDVMTAAHLGGWEGAKLDVRLNGSAK
jgi:hypothetical protein